LTWDRWKQASCSFCIQHHFARFCFPQAFCPSDTQTAYNSHWVLPRQAIVFLDHYQFCHTCPSRRTGSSLFAPSHPAELASSPATNGGLQRQLSARRFTILSDAETSFHPTSSASGSAIPVDAFRKGAPGFLFVRTSARVWRTPSRRQGFCPRHETHDRSRGVRLWIPPSTGSRPCHRCV
jgi:hypothetical protein